MNLRQTLSALTDCMKRGIRPSVQTNVPFIVYTATRGRKIKTKTKTKTKNRVNWPRTRTATMVRKFRWCLPPVVRLFWVCVCCTPDLSFYYLHGYDMRVREWCESQWGMLARGTAGRPAGRNVPRSAKTSHCTLLSCCIPRPKSMSSGCRRSCRVRFCANACVA